MIKKITLSADPDVIERARLRAAQEKITLTQAFRDWLTQYAGRKDRLPRYDQILDKLRHVRSTGPYSRNELNEGR